MKKGYILVLVGILCGLMAEGQPPKKKKNTSTTVLDYFFSKNIPENAVYFFNGDEAKYYTEYQSDTIVENLNVSDCCTGAIYQKPKHYFFYNSSKNCLNLVKEVTFGHQSSNKGGKRKVKSYIKNNFLYENNIFLLLPQPKQTLSIDTYLYDENLEQIIVKRTFSWGQISIENDTKPSRNCLIVKDEWQSFVLQRYYVYQWGLVRSELKDTELDEIEKFSLSLIKE